MVDYSKWKNIEVSDDEDETHPNIDTPSLYRWRHEARVERMEMLKREKQQVEQEKKEMAKKKNQLEKMAEKCDGNNSKYKADIDAINQKEAEIIEKQQELEKKQRLVPWNIDTIGKDGFTKTIINVPNKSDQEELTGEEKSAKLKKFTKDNEVLLKKYGMLRKHEDTKKFLMENKHLACEETSSYLVHWCINLALEEKFELLDHVSHQCIAMEFLLNLAKQLDVDPRACIFNFFTKLGKLDEAEYKTDFDKELDAFQERIRRRAIEKIEEARREEQEEIMARIKHQEDVINKLPDMMKKCFTNRDIPMLHDTLATMDLKEARKHMMKCTKAGLWSPDPNSGLKEFEVDDDDDDDAVYEEINKDLDQDKDQEQEPTKGGDKKKKSASKSKK